jgi:alpha-tubulin suppressor-like RCC1 family protein
MRIEEIGCGRAHNVVIGYPREREDKTLQIMSHDNFIVTTSDANKMIVYTWGCGTDGRLGHSEFNDVLTPTPIKSLMQYNFLSLACGFLHTVLLTSKLDIVGN